MTPDLLVVVITYNSADVITDLLDSMPAAMTGVDQQILVDHRVVVVDNGSTDGTPKLVQDRPGITLVNSENVGYAGGLNRGVAEAPGSTAPILVLNPDMRLDPGCIPAMLQALQRPRCGIVAPQVHDPDGTVFRSLRREPTLLRATGLTGTKLPALSEYVWESEAYRSAHQADWALGAALLMSRECWDACQGWDASYFLYSEETDFCLRARALGYETWFEPTATLMHIGGGSGQSGKTHAMQILNRVRFYSRRHNALAAWLYWALAVASEFKGVLRGADRSKTALTALLRPSRRPKELNLAPGFLPR